MNLSIVIPTHNRPAKLRRCLDAVQTSASGEIGSIVVVDDASNPQDAEHNAQLCTEYKANYVYIAHNRGPAHARNQGIQTADSKWIAFLDDDVTPETGWYAELTKAITDAGNSIVGIEGTTAASGRSLWDREVENAAGGLFLTSNIIYRRDALLDAGCFNEAFTGPYCEDQELAARMLRRGEIRFFPSIRVTHQPRSISGPKYITGAVRRAFIALRSEFLFWNLQRDRYHCFRNAPSFWRTLARLGSRQILISLRRRGIKTLISRPSEFGVLIFTELLEQATTLVMIPYFIFKYLSDAAVTYLSSDEISRTAVFWRIPQQNVPALLRVKGSAGAAMTFFLRQGPVYRIDRALENLSLVSTCKTGTLYLRIDDVFFDRPDDVAQLCSTMKKASVPYLTAVTARDLCSAQAPQLIECIKNSGGEIGLHGFEHTGSFGPFSCEILQMNFPALEQRITQLRQTISCTLPQVFVPPFNAISWDHLRFLSQHFRVITGGPETMRFADRWIGPLALPHGAWYFPSLQPLYGNAADMLTYQISDFISKTTGTACMTFHMQEEAKDNFVSLGILAARYKNKINPWRLLTQ